MYFKNMTMISCSPMFLFGQDKWTPLMIASENGHVDVVNVLLQHGACVHLQNKVELHLLTFLFISPHNLYV